MPLALLPEMMLRVLSTLVPPMVVVSVSLAGYPYAIRRVAEDKSSRSDRYRSV